MTSAPSPAAAPHRPRVHGGWLFAALWAATVSPAVADEVTAGLAGYVRPGAFTPVRLDDGWTAAESVPCVTTDADGLRVTRPLGGFPATDGHAVVQAGRVDSAFAFEAVGRRSRLRPGVDFRTLGPDERLWVTVGFGEADGLTSDPSVRVGGLADTAAMPRDAAGWEAAQVVLLAADDVGFDPRGTEANLALDALFDWVRAGGQLILSVGGGDGYERLRRSAPGGLPAVIGAGPFERHAALESLAGRGDGGRGASAINRLIPVDAVYFEEPFASAVLANGAGGPLVIETAFGAGRVTLVGVPLHRPPLAGWRGLDPLVERLVRRAPGLLPTESAAAAGERRRELATQVVSVADARGGGVPLAAVSVGVLLFLGVVGPLDWYLTHRLLGRPRLTWVTLPVILLAACGLAAVAGGVGETPGDATPGTARLEVGTFDAATGTASCEAWATVTAPRTQRVTATVGPSALFDDADVAGLRLGWAADPEERFGGLYRGGGRGLITTGYAVLPDPPHAAGVPLPRRAAKRFHAAWRADGAAVVAANTFRETDGRLRGTVSHALPGDLDDVLLVYGGQAYRRTGDSADAPLPPGTPFGPGSPGVRRRALGGLLTQVDTTSEEDELGGTTYRRVRGSYDPRSRDPVTVLRMLSLHDRAGGTGYTGLRNVTLEHLDLSPLVGLHRALLIGRLRTPLAAVTVDDGGEKPTAADPNDGVVTWVRILVPVEPAAGATTGGVVGDDVPIDFDAPLPRPGAAP